MWPRATALVSITGTNRVHRLIPTAQMRHCAPAAAPRATIGVTHR
jgi:hypothetical protein